MRRIRKYKRKAHDIQNIYEMRENLFCAAAFAVNADVSAVQPERNGRRHRRNTARRQTLLRRR